MAIPPPQDDDPLPGKLPAKKTPAQLAKSYAPGSTSSN